MINIRKATIGLIIALIATLILTAPVFAGLRVTNAKILDSVSPSQVKTYTMNVGDNTDEPMDIAVEVRGLGNDITGTIQALTAENDLSPYSARQFITATPATFHLEPGQSQDVTVTVTTPGDVGNGGRYADIFIHTIPSGGGQIAISLAVSAQVLLTISNSNLAITGHITSLDIPQAVSQQLLSATAVIQNTGNYHYKIACNGTVRDSQGNVVGVSWPTDTIYNLIPTFTRQVAIPLNISQELTPGTYTLDVDAYTQDGTLLDSTSKAFVITNSYKPMPLNILSIEFFSAGQLTMHQWAMSEDGTLMEKVEASSLSSDVTINILQGTKITGEGGETPAPITVTAMDEPPTPPENYSVAKAYQFNPTGVQFDQPAHVTLGYTDSDIPSGADAGQLSIATFNENTLRWDPIESEVDTVAHTITFPVTHFSVYALLTPPASQSAAATGGKTPWIWIGIGALWLVVIAVSMWMVQRRRLAAAQAHKHRGRRTPRPQGPKNDEW
jgi:P pilus assembly chaperone PapD